MKKICLTRIITILIAMAMAWPCLLSASAIEPVSGNSVSISEDIYVDGENTGAKLTQITLPAGSKYNPYASDSIINVVEAKSSSGLSFAALNCGTYTYHKSTLGNAVTAYNDTHGGTVVAAVNADPWFLYHSDYDGDGQKATGIGVKNQSITRNLLIIDGEIYQTPQTTLENMLNNNATEYNTPSSPSYIFAQNSDGSFMIGKFSPDINITNITTQAPAISADGINRLPAPGAIMIYNHRIGTESMAYTDAYEIYIKASTTAFGISRGIVGTVVGIYQPGDTNRPAIDESTIIISVRDRGSVPEAYTQVTDKIPLVRGKFAVGDTVRLDVTVSAEGDTYEASQTSKWSSVTNAIGGFYNQVTKGIVNDDLNANGTEKSNAYPVPLIALKEDGTAMMITVTSKNDVRQGTSQKYIGDICKELGAYTAIMFDGGGSTSIITYEDSTYIRRGGYADGNPRSVVNALALVFHGKNVDTLNAEKGERMNIDGVSNDSTLSSIPSPDLVGIPTTDYRFAANIDYINGKGLLGAPEAYSALSSYKHSNGTYVKAVVSDGVTADQNNLVSVTGWSVVNGGQGGHFWSVDGIRWYQCKDTSYNVNMSNWQAIQDAAVSVSNVASIFEEKAKFHNATADLTPWAGQTVNLYFGVGIHDNTRVAYMVRIENVSVPEHMHTPGDKATCTDPQICTDCLEVLAEAKGHIYDNESDAFCNECDSQRTVIPPPADTTDQPTDPIDPPPTDPGNGDSQTPADPEDGEDITSESTLKAPTDTSPVTGDKSEAIPNTVIIIALAFAALLILGCALLIKYRGRAK